MSIDDELILQICETHGTPFYLYDIGGVRRQIHKLKSALGPRFSVALSLKANPNPNLLRKVQDCCALFDVASHGEILLAGLAGIEAKRLIFVGPGKRGAELDAAIALGIGCIVAESLEEAQEISSRSIARDRITRVALRINPHHAHQAAGMAMGGLASQFGVDETAALLYIGDIARLPGIELLGVHAYLGTQVLNAEHLFEGIAYTLEMAIRLQTRAGVQFKIVDVGGGFGVPYFAGEQALDLEHLSSRLKMLLDSEAIRTGLGTQTRFIAETGRFAFADSGLYCAQVLYQKTSRDKRFCILDGGSNFNASLAGMGKLLRKNFPHRILRRTDKNREPLTEVDDDSPYTLVGPLCLPLDQLAVNSPGPMPAVGDVVVFEKSGAYGLTYSQTGFLSHLLIQEFGFEDGQLHVLKKPRTPEMLRHEFIVD